MRAKLFVHYSCNLPNNVFTMREKCASFVRKYIDSRINIADTRTIKFIILLNKLFSNCHKFIADITVYENLIININVNL